MGYVLFMGTALVLVVVERLIHFTRAHTPRHGAPPRG